MLLYTLCRDLTGIRGRLCVTRAFPAFGSDAHPFLQVQLRAHEGRLRQEGKTDGRLQGKGFEFER